MTRKTIMGRACGAALAVVMSTTSAVPQEVTQEAQQEAVELAGRGPAAGEEPQATPTATVFGTNYLNIAVNDFQPWFGGEIAGTLTEIGSAAAGGASWFRARIDSVPHGATITQVEFYFLDNDAAVDATLYGVLHNPIAGGVSQSCFGFTAAAATTARTFTLACNTTLDRVTTAYSVGFNVPAGNQNLRIQGARIAYAVTPGTLFMLPAPDRFVDTRPATTRGGKNTKFVDGETADFTITGVAGRDGNIIPAGAKGVLGNVTAVSPTQNGQFKILPGGALTTTGTSSVNFNAGFNTANAFTVRFNSAGQIRAFHSSTGGTTDLTIDIVGYYR